MLLIPFIICSWACHYTYAFTVAPDSSSTFTVTFNTSAPLGIAFDTQLRVLSFTNESGPGATSGWILPGDTLARVNAANVTGLKAAAVAALIARATPPKSLEFIPGDGQTRAPPQRTIAHEPEDELIQAIADAHARKLQARGQAHTVKPPPRASAAFEARLQAAGRDEVLTDVRLVRAFFGGPIRCQRGPLVWAEPRHGCGRYRNPEAAFNAIVLVQRGVCSFHDKALAAQEASAQGLVVVDVYGEPTRMPRSPDAQGDVSIPVGMVGVDATAPLEEALHHGGRSTVARMQLLGTQCRSLIRATREEDSNNSNAEALGLAGNTSARAGHVLLLGAEELLQQAEQQAAQRAALDAQRAQLESGEALVDDVTGVVDEFGGVSLQLSGPLAASQVPDMDAAASAWAPAAEFIRAGSVSSVPSQEFELVFARPSDGCSPGSSAMYAGKAVVVRRGTCNFAQKQQHAAAAGAALLVVVNDRAGLLEVPAAAVEANSAAVQALPIVVIPHDEGAQLEHAIAVRAGWLASPSVAQRVAQAAASVAEQPEELAQRLLTPKVRLRGEQQVWEAWAHASKLMDPHAWPAHPRQRKQQFHRSARLHHPDKTAGSVARYELLQWAFDNANFAYEPGKYRRPPQLHFSAL